MGKHPSWYASQAYAAHAVSHSGGLFQYWTARGGHKPPSTGGPRQGPPNGGIRLPCRRSLIIVTARKGAPPTGGVGGGWQVIPDMIMETQKKDRPCYRPIPFSRVVVLCVSRLRERQRVRFRLNGNSRSTVAQLASRYQLRRGSPR